MNVNERLRDQNNGTSWRTCEDRGIPHGLNEPVVRIDRDGIVSEFRQCRRCPVSIRTTRPS